MADNYWVWALGRDNTPLTTEGPWGPYDAQTARTYARISATEGTHDRAVSRGQDPQTASFEIMRIYRAGSGEHIYAGGGVTANGMQRNDAWEGDYIITELEHPGFWNAFYVGRSGSYESIMPNLMRSKDAALTFVRDHARDAGAYHAVIFEERGIGDLWQIGNFVEGRMQMTANDSGTMSDNKKLPLRYDDNAKVRYLPEGWEVYRQSSDYLYGWTYRRPDGSKGQGYRTKTSAREAAWREIQAAKLAGTYSSQYESNEGGYNDNRALAYGDLHWYKVTYKPWGGGEAITHVRAPNSAEALERASFQVGYAIDVISIEGEFTPGEWTRL